MNIVYNNKYNMYLIIILYIIILTNSLKINHKFCINCKYFIQNESGNNEYGRCSLFPYDTEKYLVTGEKKKQDYYYCSTARSYNNMCGVNATKYKKNRKSKINIDF